MLALSAIFLVARWPVGLSLGTYAFLLPFDAVLIVGQVGQIHLHLTWFVGAAAGAVLLTLGLVGRGFVRPPRFALWLSLFVFFAGMSSIWAINAHNAVFRLPVIGLLLFLYLAAVSIRTNENELAIVAWLAILGGCVAGALSLYGFLHAEGGALVQDLSGRETLATDERVTDPNTLGATLILPLSLAVGLLLSSRTWPRRTLLGGVVALISIGIYATMSRGALVATAVVFAIYLGRSRARRQVLVCIAILGAVLLVMPHAFFLRLNDALTDRGAGRLDIWYVGWQAFLHHGAIGAGLDCFPDAYNEYVHTAPNFKGFSRAPHNIYLATGVELGAAGLVLLLSAIRGHIVLAVKSRRAESDDSSRLCSISYESACWGLLASGLFLDILWEQYFWLTLMLLVMAASIRRPSREASYHGQDPFFTMRSN
jgi:O-antigen ligase